MTTVQKYTKNVVAIHELPLHFLCCTQLKTAIARANELQRVLFTRDIEIALSERETVEPEKELTSEIIVQFQQRLQSKKKGIPNKEMATPFLCLKTQELAARSAANSWVGRE